MSTGLKRKHVLVAISSSKGIALVNSIATAGTPNGITSSPIDTTGANLLVVCTSIYLTGQILTDSKGNTWIGLTNHASSAGSAKIYYAANAIVGTGHTFSITGTGIYPAIVVYAFSGAASSPFQVETGITGTSPLNTGSVTPSSNGSVIVTMLEKDSFTTTPTINLGFTLTTVAGVGGVNIACSAAFLIQSVAASINPQWTWTPIDAATSIAVFKRS